MARAPKLSKADHIHYNRDGVYIYICIYGGFPKYSINMWDSKYLVGGLEHEFYFSIQLGMSSSQLTNFFFSRGVGIPPTRLLLTIINHIITNNFIIITIINSIYGAFLSHRGAPSSHPLMKFDGISMK